MADIGQQIILDGQQVFLQLIQGQARIEAKLDILTQRESELQTRVCILEQETNMMKGERRFLKLWLPIIIAILNGFISYIMARMF